MISLQGQESHNGLTWMNAFPWLKSSSQKGLPRDDVRFTEHVLDHVSGQLLKDLGDTEANSIGRGSMRPASRTAGEWPCFWRPTPS